MNLIWGIFEVLEIKDLTLLLMGGALGYLLSLVAAKQTEKKKALVLEVTGRYIVAERTFQCPFFLVDHQGKNLENIYFVFVRVWNRGRETVRGDEISPTAPLMIEIEEEAVVIGDPLITKPHENMSFSISSPKQNKFQFSFDCLNYDEWVQVGFYITGSPTAAIKGSGRVFGQHADFAVTTDDSHASFQERILSLFAVLVVITSPISLLGAGYWTYSESQLSNILYHPEVVPKTLVLLLTHGLVISSIATFYFISIWLKRKKNPKGYPIYEDFEPTQSQSLRAFYLTALRGKRHVVSTSIKDYGQIIMPSDSKQHRQ